MKEIYDDKFGRELGDKLRGLREEPPAGMFERIEETLVSMGAVEKSEPKPEVRPLPLWQRPIFRGVAAAAVVVVAVIGALLLQMQEPAEEQFMAVVEQTKEPDQAETKRPQEPSVESSAIVAAGVPEVSNHPQIPLLSESAMRLSSDVDEQMVVATTKEESEVKAEEPVKNETKKIKSSKRTRRKSTTRKSDAELEEYWRSILEEEPRQRGATHPTQVALYASNVGFDRGNMEVNNLANSTMLTQEHNELSGGGSYFAPSLVQLTNHSNLEHFMPVTVGVTVSYSLNDWFSVNSGLLYTNLYSKGDYDGALSRYGCRRTMDYIGVPLNVSFHFADLGPLALYAKLGGSLEFCVSAKDKLYLDGALYDTERLSASPLNFALDASVGLDYALWGGFGLFGEVGCNYWMAPKGSPENYRTAHPLSLSAKFGVSFTFN